MAVRLPTITASGFRASLIVVLAAGLAINAHGQIRIVEDEPIDISVPDPTSPRSRAEAEANRTRIALERELVKLRAAHFRGPPQRGEPSGWAGQASDVHTDPAAYEPLLKVFAREEDDVYATLASMFAECNTPEADAALAWSAIMAGDDSLRRIASDHMRSRILAIGGPTPQMVAVMDLALQGDSEDRANVAAAFADEFGIIGLIPRLISAQVSGQTGGGGTIPDDDGDVAFIAIGRQVAFVSDLTPVVSDSAVAFDPTVSVINEGTLIRVHDAAITIYRDMVHASLVNLSSRASGRSTRELGFDTDAWKRWYIEEFLPARRQQELADQAERQNENDLPEAPAPAGG
jgi:hypothetical protein